MEQSHEYKQNAAAGFFSRCVQFIVQQWTATIGEIQKVEQLRTHKSILPTGTCEIVEYHYYCPAGVQQVLATGTSAFIGVVDDLTVLKYPLELGGDMSRLDIEHQILLIVGQHPRIIAHKGFTDAGLYLERAANGTIFWYLAESKQTATLAQRIAWCRELTEAVEHVHSRHVIHCDIQPTNILLDKDLDIKLADFQGNYLSSEGIVLLTGGSGEPCRYFCPRDDEFEADVQTDLFALGSTIYFIMTGHEVFPDIIGGNEGWDEEVRSRFKNNIFPVDSHACEAITRKCWERQYSSASEILVEIRRIEQNLVCQATPP